MGQFTAKLGRYEYLRFDVQWKLAEKAKELSKFDLEGLPEEVNRRITQVSEIVRSLSEAPEQWKQRDECSDKPHLDVIIAAYRDLRARETAAAASPKTRETHEKLNEIRVLLLGSLMHLGSWHIRVLATGLQAARLVISAKR